MKSVIPTLNKVSFIIIINSIIILGNDLGLSYSANIIKKSSSYHKKNTLAKKEFRVKHTYKDTTFSPSKTSSLDSLNLINSNNKKIETDSLNYSSTLKWYSMITNIPDDWVNFYHKDITFQKIPLYLGIAGLTAGLMFTDNQTWKASHKFYESSNLHKTLSDIFEFYGDGRTQFGLAAAFALYGFIQKDNRALRTASEIVEAVLASGAVVQLIKHITGRESPLVSTKPGGVWRFFPNQINYLKHTPAYDAFPSGHLTTSLAALIVIADNYSELKWIEPVGFSAEALLAVSMVNTGIHWYSDYPLAVFLGYAFGEIIAHHHYLISYQNHADNKLQLLLSPYFNYNGSGLSVSLEF